MGWLDLANRALEWATERVDPTPVRVDDGRRRHRRGAMLWQPRDPRRYAQELQREILSWERQRGGKSGFRLYGEAGLTWQQEVLGIGLMGAIGAGKTQIGSLLVEQAIARGDLVVVTDAKGDLTSWLLTQHQSAARLLAPWDARSMVYAVHEDVRTRPAASDLARALLPERVEGRDPFWPRAARVVVETIVLYLIATGEPWGWSDVWSWIVRGAGYVIARFRETEEGRAALIVIASKTDARSVEDVWRTVVTYLAPLRDLAAAWPGVTVPDAWSARAWLSGTFPWRVLILPMPADHDTIARSNARLAIEAIAARLLAMPDSRDRRVVFFLDEFPTLGELPALGRLLVQARSKGGVPILAMQDLGQLYAAWGRNGADTIINTLGTLCVFRIIDPGLADWCCRALGKHEVEERLETHGRHEGHDTSRSTGEQVHVRDEYVVHPSDLPRLEDLVAYVRAPGWPRIARLAWHVTPRDGSAQFVEEAAWVTRAVTPVEPEPGERRVREREAGMDIFAVRPRGQRDKGGERDGR